MDGFFVSLHIRIKVWLQAHNDAASTQRGCTPTS